MISTYTLKCAFTILLCTSFLLSSGQPTRFIEADHEFIQYTGRIDFSNPKKPRFWAPGVYINAKFAGPFCKIIVNDEILHGTSHNYLSIVIDNEPPVRLQTVNKTDTITVADGLSPGEHTIVICKNTEANIGYLEFIGFLCEGLLPSPPKPVRKIEFIGNSITCGMGNDLSKIDCDKGHWYDQHNAYLSYGPMLARRLNAQWHLTAYSGIGIIHSCCNIPMTMSDIFDKINLHASNAVTWNFNQYQPDALTICLGQNDGIQDSTKFCSAYVQFIETIRTRYPHASIVCLTSPMATPELTAVLKKYITAIVTFINKKGDDNVHKFFFTKSYQNGCGQHPDLKDHEEIANELFGFFKETLHW